MNAEAARLLKLSDDQAAETRSQELALSVKALQLEEANRALLEQANTLRLSQLQQKQAQQDAEMRRMEEDLCQQRLRMEAAAAALSCPQPSAATSKSTPCKLFGSPDGCKYGEACKFVHAEKSRESFAGKKSALASVGNEKLAKPVSCRHFGTPEGCKSGDTCKFLHSHSKQGHGLSKPQQQPKAHPKQHNHDHTEVHVTTQVTTTTTVVNKGSTAKAPQGRTEEKSKKAQPGTGAGSKSEKGK
jgi:hypothetical protein